jgi:hypothetical protein
MAKILKKALWWSAGLGFALSTAILSTGAASQVQDQQDQQDDPPSRVARVGFMEGAVSFQPAGEPDWVQAVANRPMTTGDKLWTDKDSRAELQLGSAVIRLNSNTGFSFLNLDDNAVQIQLTSGAVNLRVRRLDRDDVVEIDTPNLAFSVTEPGSYRVEASEDGTYSVVSIREGGGDATGNGQTYTLHVGQRGTFSGRDSLNAEVIDIGGRDQFDNWAYNRDRYYDESRSARYVSQDVVGCEDLDDYGDWRDDSNYGHVWFPNRVAAGWAPYHEGHWVWISPWGYTWVDDSPWGYAPFHYGRWVTVGGRWGWVAGPVAVRAVYAPALVVFIGGGGVGVGFGGNVGWFPLGPREVYVPSYQVSREYVNRVNISNTTVNNVQITNVYNTTIINKSTNITNVTYANRNVRGAVTAVPQRAFVSAQPVGRAAVAMNAPQIARATVSVRVAVAPTRDSVLGAKFATANHVAAPPQAVMNRQVIAKRTPPSPPVPFANQQQALAAHPGQPLARSEVRKLRPAGAEGSQPIVKQAPPGKPATANVGRPGNQQAPSERPGAANPVQGNRPPSPQPNEPNAARWEQPASPPPTNQPANQQAPNERPGATNPRQPNRQPSTPPNQPAPPEPNNRPVANQPNNRSATNRPTTEPTNNRPNSQRDATRPQTNRLTEPPARNDRPSSPKPNNRPEPARPVRSQPEPNRNQRALRPQTPPPTERQQQRTPPPVPAKPAAPTRLQQPKAQTPAEKKQEEQRRKQEENKPPDNREGRFPKVRGE